MRGLLYVLLWAGLMTGAGAAEMARPNVLWITCEDMSPLLGCYGDSYAITPHLGRLAREGVRYTRAFATAPVCSPARSCLFTGLYATTLGTQHVRSQFPIPETFKGYPAYLRRSGYFCSNNVKTDYNVRDERRFIEEAWDECSSLAHWRHRKPGQPFFSVFNLMETHQSRLNVWSFEEFEQDVGRRLPPSERHDSAQAPVPPYYPDTPLVRRTIARAYGGLGAGPSQGGAMIDCSICNCRFEPAAVTFSDPAVEVGHTLAEEKYGDAGTVCTPCLANRGRLAMMYDPDHCSTSCSLHNPLSRSFSSNFFSSAVSVSGTATAMTA